MTGKIYPKNTMFLRVNVGKAADPETKIEYELTTHAGGGSPLVCSSKTGKYFQLMWADIINLAIEAGIDKPD